VYRLCRDSTTAQLKAPATAVYPALEQLEKLNGYGFRRDDGRVYELLGYVDAENTFGALLRTDFLCTLELQEGSWTGRSILMSGD
jgi:hypothetical protein